MPESALLDHRGQLQCPLCLSWVQRTPTGTLADGMAAHQAAVHKDEGTAVGDIARAREHVGQRLADARIEAGLTQGQVAARTGISRSAIANIEAGRQDVTLSRLLLFIQATGTDPSRLIQPVDLWPVMEAPRA